MPATAPNYDNVRWPGADSLRIPTEAGSASLEVCSYVPINVGGAGSTNAITLTPAQAAASEIVVTNAGSGATTINFPAAVPGSIFVVYNNSGQACTFKVIGQTGVSVANAKHALLVCESTDIARVTADT